MLPPFATPNDYATVYGATTGRTEYDLLAASQTIRDYCGWQVWPQVTETLTLDGPGTEVLMLPTKHLVAVTEVTEQLPGTGAAVTTLNVADLEWSKTGMVWRTTNVDYWRYQWTQRARGITITCTHGYLEVPQNILGLTMDLARRAAQNPAGHLSSVSVGGRSESYGKAQATGLLLEEQATLQPYWLAM